MLLSAHICRSVVDSVFYGKCQTGSSHRMLLPLYESIANRLHPLEQQHQHNPSSLYPNSIADSLPLASVSSRTTAESLAWSSSNSSSIRPAQNYPIPSEKSSFSKQSVDHQNTVNTLNTKNQLISMSLASSRSSDYRNMTFAAAPFTEHHVNNRDTSSTAQKMITDPTYHDDAPRPNGTEFLREDLTQAHFTPFMDSLGFNATSSSYVPHPNSTIGAATGGGGVFGGWMSETMDSILKGQTTDFQTSNTPSVCGQPTDAFHLTGNSLTDHLYAAQANGRAAALSLSGSTARCIERDQFNLINQHQPRGTAPPPPTFAAPYGGQNGYQSGAGRNYNRPVPSLNIMNSNAAGVLTSDTSANFFAGRSIGSTQALSVSAASPMNCSSMMTPDSSTAGYSTNRLGASSDESEVSPTPTNSSSAALTPNQTRKTAPTLATGRRNLKNEPVGHAVTNV